MLAKSILQKAKVNAGINGRYRITKAVELTETSANERIK
tara:strand:+ start:1502 stop:1618 length:117 start_codon:yes stop_codon:yes gene_type:complete